MEVCCSEMGWMNPDDRSCDVWFASSEFCGLSLSVNISTKQSVFFVLV